MTAFLNVDSGALRENTPEGTPIDITQIGLTNLGPAGAMDARSISQVNNVAPDGTLLSQEVTATCRTCGKQTTKTFPVAKNGASNGV